MQKATFFALAIASFIAPTNSMAQASQPLEASHYRDMVCSASVTPKAAFNIFSEGIANLEAVGIIAQYQLGWLAQLVNRRGLDDFTLKINITDRTSEDNGKKYSIFNIRIISISAIHSNSTQHLTRENIYPEVKKGIISIMQMLSDDEKAQ